MLTESQFKEIYTRYQSTGLSIRSFCINEGINEAKFYYWKKRLKNFHSGSFSFIPVKVEGSQGLVSKDHIIDNPVFSTASKSADSNCSFEITYPNGTKLKFSGVADYALVKSLVLLNR